MDMKKRALLVGIDQYQHMPALTGCVADATVLCKMLQNHENEEPNYDCRLLTSTDKQPVTREVLRARVEELFLNAEDHVLFYLSGHGKSTRSGAFLVTQDGTMGDPGLPMDQLLNLANQSKAKTILLILDCCYAGQLGDPSLLQDRDGLQTALLREGVTILAASRSSERAYMAEEHSVFTKLLLGALAGGAADVRGRVSAASIYAYIEQVLNSWEQRPMYKSHAAHLPPVRLCKPSVPDKLLRELPKLFPEEASKYTMAPSYEHTHPTARQSHVDVFNKFKVLRNARMLSIQAGKDLYSIALESGWVRLTPLGQFYWLLATKNQL
jgi:caspase domain-containing protein